MMADVRASAGIHRDLGFGVTISSPRTDGEGRNMGFGLRPSMIRGEGVEHR